MDSLIRRLWAWMLIPLPSKQRVALLLLALLSLLIMYFSRIPGCDSQVYSAIKQEEGIDIVDQWPVNMRKWKEFECKSNKPNSTGVMVCKSPESR